MGREGWQRRARDASARPLRDNERARKPPAQRGNEGYRRVLWAVLAINAAMFAVEVIAGLAAGSASLQADALDFLGTRPTTRSAFSSSEWPFATAPQPRS